MPRFCLFGDTVNVASRMESHGEVNKIHCSENTASLLASTGLFDITKRGQIEVKGKGCMTTYFINSASENNINSNRSAIQKAMENALTLVESSTLEIIDDLDGAENLPIFSLLPKEAFKSSKSSFSFREVFSMKNKDESTVSTPIATPLVVRQLSPTPSR